MKKLIAFGAGAGLLLAAAVPAFALGGSWDVAIVRNNSASSTANTGLNGQGNSLEVGGSGEVEENEVGGNNTMTTGDAWASSKAVVVANTHVGCGCERRGHKDIAYVGNNSADATANTGINGQGNYLGTDGGGEVEENEVGGNNTMTTGAAGAESKAFVLVNTHVSFGNED